MYRDIVDDDSKDKILMFRDTEVMRFNFSKCKFEILSEVHMPYSLRGVIKSMPEFAILNSGLEVSNRYRDGVRNTNLITWWLSSRVITLSRSNAKKIYLSLKLNLDDTEQARYHVALSCRALSVLDCYWIKFEGESINWCDVDLKHNSLNEAMFDVALHGKFVSLCGSYYGIPDLTTEGLFPKAWKRCNDKCLWLYKRDLEGMHNAEVEVEVSRVLDKCNVNHVKYVSDTDNCVYVCRCKCISTDELSVIPADEFIKYCKNNGLNFVEEVLKIDSDSYYKMHIVDYLVSNPDRHAYNWGFFMNNESMQLVAIHPLFDHNNSFDIDAMKDKWYESSSCDKTLRDSALDAIKHVDFHFTADISKSDFDDESHYQSFISKAEELGIKTVINKNPFMRAISKM